MKVIKIKMESFFPKDIFKLKTDKPLLDFLFFTVNKQISPIPDYFLKNLAAQYFTISCSNDILTLGDEAVDHFDIFLLLHSHP